MALAPVDKPSPAGTRRGTRAPCRAPTSPGCRTGAAAGRIPAPRFATDRSDWNNPAETAPPQVDPGHRGVGIDTATSARRRAVPPLAPADSRLDTGPQPSPVQCLGLSPIEFATISHNQASATLVLIWQIIERGAPILDAAVHRRQSRLRASALS